MPARGLALLALTLVSLAMAGCGEGEATETGHTAEDVSARFQKEAGSPLFRRQGPGGDPAWEQLGFEEDAPRELLERYGTFSIYVVKPGEQRAMASLFRDKATGQPLPRRRGIYWELDTHSDTWTAHTRYANLVLVWFSEEERPVVDARWHRLHRILRDLTA